MHKLPSLSSLRTFEAAARLGSFSLAADELSVTASAVSHQVKLLEGNRSHPPEAAADKGGAGMRIVADLR